MFESVTQASSVDTSTKSGTAQTKLNEDLNQFLNLLVTQLKNQDPLDPMDANEFTSQLVQFASVEQQIYQNANLEKLLNVEQTSQIANMVDFIGHTIEATGSSFHLENDSAEFTYEFKTTPNSASINIMNSSGLTVYSSDADNETGKQSFKWDGKNENGIQQPDGTYMAVVTGKDRDGNLMNVTQTVFGRVTGAGAEEGIVSLFMNDIKTGMDKVLGTRETIPTPTP